DRKEPRRMRPLERTPRSRSILALAATAIMLAVAAPLAAAPSADVKAAEEELKKSINGSDLEGADKAIAKLRQLGGEDAVKSLIGLAQKMPAGQESTYWRLVNGAAGFRDDGGLRAVCDTILDAKAAAISRDLMFALANNRVPKVALVVYQPVLEKGTDEFRLMA